ncbi:MAG: sigma-70 family RNA polymerase sigma factor [Clostridia bacterium]|nr:sigma-70 family RNA polymerase sigma factor [Clostridia bacterium]
MYPSEYIISDKHGHKCLITTEWLYQAILSLSEKYREILILEFWCGYTKREIAESFNVTERTIYNRKQKAFKSIRNYYERKA